MIKKIRENNIDISPDDLEWVIDCWEKVAVNEGKQGKLHLRNRFKEIHSDKIGLLKRVTDSAMDNIFDKCWKR